MSVIQNLPAYARPEADTFRATGHLAGDNVKRQNIPASAVAEAEAQLTQQLDQLIQLDESEMDLAKNELGKVKIDQMGMTATAFFEGDTRTGELAMEAQAGAMDTAAFAEFSAQSANIVQVLDLGGGEYATVGAHFDRQTPANSYIEMKNVPDGFNVFGG